MKLVSIIIPTFNRPEIVKRAIASAENQTYKNIEIIVVDDGSTVKYEVSHYHKPWQKNKGGSAARNYGVAIAKGDFIVFIDDDNEIYPDFIKKMVDNIGEYDAITSGRVIKSPEFTTKAIPSQTEFPAIDWGWLIKSHVFDKIQYDPTIWGDEDADFGIQFHNAGFKYNVLRDYLQIAHVPSAKDETSSNTFPNKRRLEGLSNFLTKNLHYYTDPNERRYILRLAGRNFMKGGYYWKGLFYFYQSYKAMPNMKTLRHLLFAIPGWKCYDAYMSFEEKRLSKI